MTARPRVLPYGRRAVLVEFDSAQQRRRAVAALGSMDLTDLEVVPADRTILLHALGHDSAGLDRCGRAARTLIGLLDEDLPDGKLPGTTATRTVDIIVRYDGPDLDTAATQLGRSVQELIRWHTDESWSVEFLGFMPGFGYLTRPDHTTPVTRRTTPRTRIPAGSVALAGLYSAIYPTTSPGGWQLIGRTERQLFDPAHGAALRAGDAVRFRPEGWSGP